MNNWDQWIRQSLLPTATVILIYEIIKGIIRGLGRSRSDTKQREDQFNGSSNQLNTSQIDARIDARMNSILEAKIDARISFLLGSPVPGQIGASAAEYKTAFTIILKERGKKHHWHHQSGTRGYRLRSKRRQRPRRGHTQNREDEPLKRRGCGDR